MDSEVQEYKNKHLLKISIVFCVIVVSIGILWAPRLQRVEVLNGSVAELTSHSEKVSTPQGIPIMYDSKDLIVMTESDGLVIVTCPVGLKENYSVGDLVKVDCGYYSSIIGYKSIKYSLHE